MNCSATRKSKIICARNWKLSSVCGVKICSVNLHREIFLWHWPWFVLQGPGTSWGALIPPAAPWFVLRGPVSSTGTRFVLRGSTSSCRPSSVSRALLVPRGPDPSYGAMIRHTEPWFVMRALIRRSGPWSVLRGPDSYCKALIRSVVPDLSRRALIRLTGPDLSCGALIRLAGSSRGARVRSVEPWFFLRGPIRPAGPWNLIKNRPQLWAQAGPGGPASVWGATYMLVPGAWPLGGRARMPPPPPPWERHCHGVQFQTRLLPCTFAYVYLPKTT